MSPTACGTSTSSERPRQGSRETIPDTPRPYCRHPGWIKAGVSEGRGAVCCLGGTGWGEALGVQGEGRELHLPQKSQVGCPSHSLMSLSWDSGRKMCSWVEKGRWDFFPPGMG